MLRRAIGLAGVWALAGIASFGIATAQEKGGDAGTAAGECPEQTAVLEAAGIEVDSYGGSGCPSMEQARRIADSHLALQAEAAATRAEGEKVRAQAGPDVDEWMIGVGDEERPLNDEEREWLEEHLANQGDEGGAK